MARFIGKDLSGMDLSKAHQWSAHQYGLGSFTDGHPEISIRDSIFQGADLSEVQLCESQGENVCFCNCKMANADFAWCYLTGACFEHADLGLAQFIGARVLGGSFVSSNLGGTSFKSSKLSKSCFYRARFSSETNFECADLTQCCFVDTNLSKLLGPRDVLFPDSDVAGADFRVDQTIAGARLPKRVRLELASRGAVVDPPSDEDWDEAAFYEGYPLQG